MPNFSTFGPDYFLGQGQDEPVLVQAFVAEPPIEALDLGILHQSARPNE